MKAFVYLTGDESKPVDKMELALQAILSNEGLYKKVQDLKAYKFGHLKEKLQEKVHKGELTQEEMDSLVKAEKLRWDAIQVDEFIFDSMKGQHFKSVIDDYPSPLEG